MGISIVPLQFDHVFRTLALPPVIINDIQDSSIEDKTNLNRTIFTTYNTDLLSNIPTCECGDIAGEYNLGIVCGKCNTPVKQPQGDLESFVWLRAPEGVRGLINPTVWAMLCKHFTKSSFSIVRWLTDRSYRNADVKTPDFMPVLESFGFQRGLNYFIDNFDYIMECLFSMKIFKTKEPSDLERFIKTYRDCIFSQYLPLPNKTLLVVEENNSGTYVDPVLTGGIDAIRTLVGIDSALLNYSVQVKENRTVKCIDKLSEFYLEYYRTTLAQKEGVFRKHIFGTRSHFSFRAVISSITGPHNYDEIFIPWGVAVNVLKFHIANKLLRRGWTPNEINSFLYEHTQKYHPTLDQIFKELIDESPNKRIPCVFTRNPSLMRGSCQALGIAGIKTVVEDPTISMSILICRAFNADFDGDAMGCTLSIDNHIAKGLENLAPHKSSFDFDSYRGVSSNLLMPKPVVSTIANWLDYDD